MIKTSDYDYNLPLEKIAQYPLYPRDSSKLLVYNKQSKIISHEIFSSIIDHLNKGDVLVVNETKVIPARLFGIKKDTNASIEILLLTRLDINHYEIIAKPSKRLKIGTIVYFDEKLSLEVIKRKEDGVLEVKLLYVGILEEILDELGQMPLPPYITEKLEDKDRYQTVYSNQSGSSAAPTAGLHFTNELLKKIEEKGIVLKKVLLHVGLATFRPVKDEDLTEHKLHSEYIELSQDVVDAINLAKSKDKRVMAVGTTTVRVLESVFSKHNKLVSYNGFTDIFIYPPYKFKVVDSLITNFHLPKSTLLMLVSAFTTREEILKVYSEAIMKDYRFFSFGDAMLIE